MNKKKYNYKLIIALTLIPSIGILGTIWYVWNFGIVWQEPILLLIFWIITGLGITVGYHRLFSHRSFKAHPVLEWVLVISGAAALQNTALQWCSNHRRHHKHLDTDSDPYSITKGFFHAHMGWILEGKIEPIVKVEDLKTSPAVMFQYKYYYLLFIFFGILLPIALGLSWGRPFGALFWGVFLRIAMVHHFTYFINSLCHYIGTKPYDSESTSRDSWYMAFFTFGEGFHNYHHKFQWDYRNGIRWYHFDPSKWSIWCLSKLGLTKGLKRTEPFQVLKARSTNICNQVQSKLENVPENIRRTYQNKLFDIKGKITNLEINWEHLENEMETFIAEKKILSYKFLVKQKKQYQIQYNHLIKSLSVMLFTLQDGIY